MNHDYKPKKNILRDGILIQSYLQVMLLSFLCMTENELRRPLLSPLFSEAL